MSDLPPEHPDTPGDPERTLRDLLSALSNVGDDGGVDDDEDLADGLEDEPPVAGAVGELRTALDRLFELIRSERAEGRARVAELEAALSVAHARIRQLEAGEELEAPAPPPNDFGQLREAAERLRQRTQQLVRDAGAADGAEVEGELALAPEAPGGRPAADDAEHPEAEDRLRAARDAVEASLAEEAEAARGHGAPDDDHAADEPAEFGRPAVLQAFPGTTPHGHREVEVESDLAFAQEAVIAVPVPQSPRPEGDEPEPDDTEPEPLDADASTTDAPTGGPDGAPGTDEPGTDEPRVERRGRGGGRGGEPPSRPEPEAVEPRPARKRRAGLRRRRIDARKLVGVDPATALRAMVAAVDDVWTAGASLDLVIALTDGGALKVSGGHDLPLKVDAVDHGTSARTTVTATTAQLVPLFGRLELTAEQSAPLIHGDRRDADLLVGWIDRAQRLEAQPL